ncbi:hypothetical protein [Gordonia sp. (in: high G+C Gram-positive bacteria)]|uniref:hypothetical protein n=1 Tax=Gordonia sp. (in: high G+C Gram-positive bacteria) TaxID=84139 RepID=UPI00262B689A|nr:hypothetical protein [Gordonia sp. (in: high G+C Gram-positive bacteria)]
MTDAATAKPDPARRPNTVRWALRLWLTSGVLLMILGVISIITSAFGAGWHLGDLAVAVIVVGIGLVYASLARKAYCQPQWRGSLAALTVVVVIMVLVLTIGYQSPGLAVVLAAAVVGLAGSILAYRPDADAWFNCRLNRLAAAAESGKDE